MDNSFCKSCGKILFIKTYPNKMIKVCICGKEYSLDESDLIIYREYRKDLSLTVPRNILIHGGKDLVNEYSDKKCPKCESKTRVVNIVNDMSSHICCTLCSFYE